MRWTWVLTACVALGGCSANGITFLELPDLASDTQTVVAATECGAELSVSVYDVRDGALDPIEPKACAETMVVTLIEYTFSRSREGWATGPLPRAPVWACLSAPLPTETNGIHRAELRDDSGAPAFVDASNLSPVLAGFRYEKHCDCQPLVEFARFPLPEPALFTHLRPLDDGAILITAATTNERVDFYTYDLSTLEHIGTATVPPSHYEPGARPPSSTADIERGPDGRYFFGAALGRIYEMSLDGSVRLFATTATTGRVVSLSVSGDGEPLEIFALTEDPVTLSRITEDGVTTYDDLGAFRSAASRRQRVERASPGVGVAFPKDVETVVYVEGERSRAELWDWAGRGHAQALGFVPDLGLLVGTKFNQVFRLDPAGLKPPAEVLGPEGQRMEPNPAWWMDLRPAPGGFVGVMDGPYVLVRYITDAGFCPLHPLDRATGSVVALREYLIVGTNSYEDFLRDQAPTVTVFRPQASD